MKLIILCTMLKQFGRKGHYNTQEIGLGRSLARMGHQVEVFKGVPVRDQEETLLL